MGDHKEKGSVTRRDVLKLAGTAAAFCSSFGFLHGEQTGGQTQVKGESQLKWSQAELQHKWEKAELKWYAGSTLLHSSAIPASVAKHIAANSNAVVELKLFLAGQLLKNLGAIQRKV